MAVTSSLSPGFSLQWNMVVLYNLGGRSLIFFFFFHKLWSLEKECLMWWMSMWSVKEESSPQHCFNRTSHIMWSAADFQRKKSNTSRMLTDVTPDNREQWPSAFQIGSFLFLIIAAHTVLLQETTVQSTFHIWILFSKGRIILRKRVDMFDQKLLP